VADYGTYWADFSLIRTDITYPAPIQLQIEVCFSRRCPDQSTITPNAQMKFTRLPHRISGASLGLTGHQTSSEQADI
jgi:hypothetical protein